MQSSVRTAVIPAAGLGTRFLPVTKAVPKELLPIVDRPILQLNLEEIHRAGLSRLVLVTSPDKSSLLKLLKEDAAFSQQLKSLGRYHLIEELEELRKNIEIVEAPQIKPKGLGHAVLCAKEAVGAEPFALLLGDELMVEPVPKEAKPSGIAELIEVFHKTQTSTLAVMEVSESEVHKYGVAEGNWQNGSLNIKNLIEKPSPEQTRSRWALPGRYVFQPEIFSILEDLPPGKNSEIQLTDALVKLAQGPGLLGKTLRAQRFDAGDKLGYLKANIEMGLRHPEIGESLKNYLMKLKVEQI